MKPHLPRTLLNSLLALMFAAAPSLEAAYTAPTSITIPGDYSEVIVTDISDMGEDSKAYRITRDLIVDDSIYRPSGSYITSDSASSLSSLIFDGTRVYADYDTPTIFTNLNEVSFINNYIDDFSGVLEGEFYLTNNKLVSISNNSDDWETTGEYSSVFGCYDDICVILINNNRNVNLCNNTNSGGLIWTYHGRSNPVKIRDNDNVTISGNFAPDMAPDPDSYENYSYYSDLGAINLRPGTTFDLLNNKRVILEKNGRVYDGIWRLRSIYADEGGVTLSAPKGGEICIRDSIYLKDCLGLKLNKDYETASGSTIKQTGDIIFSGAYTAAHLKELKGGVAATRREIINSQTSEVEGITTLYGGRMRVEDGAIFVGKGFDLAANSGATLRLHNGHFRHSNFDIIIDKGTTFELSGTNTVNGNIHLEEGSTLSFNLGSAQKNSAAMNLAGSLNIWGAITLSFAADGVVSSGNYRLIDGAYLPTNWKSLITLDAPSDWQITKDSLYLDHNSLWITCQFKPMTSGTWKNSSGNRIWSTSAVNWEQSGAAYAFTKGAAAIFYNTGAGTVTLSGALAPSSVLVHNAATGNYTWTGTGSLTGSMKLTKKGAGSLTINTANTFTGGTDFYAGTIKIGKVTALGTGKINLLGGTLNLSSLAPTNTITLSGNALISNGANYKGSFSMTAGTLKTGSVLGIASGKTATIKGGTICGTISGAGSTAIAGQVNLTNGSITTSKLTIYSGNKLNVTQAKGLVAAKNIQMGTGGKLSSAGPISATSLSASGNSLVTISGAYPRAVSIADTATLSNSGMNLDGYLTAKNLTLSSGRLYQHNSANGIKVTNKLTMGSGSTLSTGAALTLNSAAISGGTINMTSSTLQRINVTYTFNLTGAMDLNLGCNLTKGVTYKLITYGKTNLTSTSNLTKLLGMTGAGCKLIYNSKYIAIQVTDSAAWDKYIAANKTTFYQAYTAVTDSVAPTDLDDGDEPGALPAYDGGETPGTDLTLHTALVQSSWGTVHASRAFVDALSNRMQNATTLGENKSTAAWLSVLGGAGRISWDGAYAGSDYHLTGAAFGMQQQLTTRSTMGLAIGNSWGKVSSFGAPAIDQDTTHIALYGDSTLLQREKDALTLSWSAAYGRSDSDMTLDGINSEWEQKVLQMNARATYGYALSERTTLSGFAGLEYLATDSGDIAPGAASGSVQNLRGEIGVSLGHKFSDRSSMYAELSFVGDMVRHNPTAELGGVRSKGSNPGRAGINFSVGGSHALNENWSVNAAYNLELMQHTNSHSANIGFSRSF